MNNLISILFHNQSIQLQTDLINQQLPKLPIELMEFVKIGDAAILDIMSLEDGTIQGILKTDKQEFSLAINNKILNTIKGTNVELPVKIGKDGQLLLQKSTLLPESIKPSADISIKNQNMTIELSSLKLSDFIDNELKSMNVSKEVREYITKDIPKLEAKVDNLFENKNIKFVKLQNIHNILKQIAENPNSFNALKSSLLQEINNLVGQKVLGEVTNFVNEMTVIKTPLGETHFDAKVKLPIGEQVVVTIKSIAADYSKEIQTLDNTIKSLFQSEKTLIKPEELIQYPQLKSLAKIIDQIPKDIAFKIVDKITLTPNNLIQTLFTINQIDNTKDLFQLIGKNLNQEILQVSPKGEQIVQEINNALINSIKDTPSWRIIEMPLFDGNQLQPFKFAVKKDSNKNNHKASKQKSGTRFIVETEFSKLGSFQFDGFSNVLKRNFDLIIRTSKYFDDDFCSNIINLFKKSLYKLDYSGTIKINCKSDFIKIYEQSNMNEGIYA